MFVYISINTIFVGQGIACQIKPTNINMMQGKHAPLLEQSVQYQNRFIPHPHELPVQIRNMCRRCLPYTAIGKKK
jgi:hypothetical protein